MEWNIQHRLLNEYQNYQSHILYNKILVLET